MICAENIQKILFDIGQMLWFKFNPIQYVVVIPFFTQHFI